MNNDINKIFSLNKEILQLSDKTITHLRLQNFREAFKFCNKTIDTLSAVMESIFVNAAYFNDEVVIVDESWIESMLCNLLNAQEMKDYVLLADLLEQQLNPFLFSLQEKIITKEELLFDSKQYENNIKLISKKNFLLGKLLKQINPVQILETDYAIEYTSCGNMTLALYEHGNKYYLHSNGHVYHEAGLLAKEWFSPDIFEYNVYGLGLGYHIMELMEINESLIINVYESDLNVISLACAFSDIEKLLTADRIHIIYDPDFKEMISSINSQNKEMKLIFHYPSLRNIKNSKIRDEMEDYFISYSSIKNQLHKLNSNFNINWKHQHEYVDNLRDQFKGKDLYIIAAGPSLDKNYLELKKIKENSVILATGTVFKMLLKAGIKPDYIIMIDANHTVYPQIQGIEDSEIPLLYLSTVYYKVPECYKGKKYFICQEGFHKAEEYAKNRGYTLFQTGGSVSTTALDLGISFGCKRIICVGLDLAFTNNFGHAAGASIVQETASNEYLRMVEDINGNMVGTIKNLDIYRKWIEKRIEGIHDIEFIDATEGGAKIKGMKIMKLVDCIGYASKEKIIG
ncbi:motility associated factor glycosyltransferase family protein [Mobilitalea sibirica]|uniref:Motility associated factor glycosyltransferase family protein n=1 Tax=Mobilitalea sibirica TaxID=1462919 RepID=A0A8J7H5B9_9FIRM|nr:6-hydroxymethylpterin diphosphokinase MptE-like protein [Mobilitalea sibirica]MBH1942482.1 motility associated factor glycosyltransferase family protein [Mobilitalea sibirica]